MKAILIMLAMLGAGALGYVYWHRNDGRLPALEALGEPGQKLSDRSQQFHQSVGKTVAAAS